MADTAQKLITLASQIVSNCLSQDTSSETKTPKMGARNQVYYSALNGECPKSLVPMLTAMVSGALKSKKTLIKCAHDDGLFSLKPEELPTGCGSLCESITASGQVVGVNAELLVVLYEVLLGSRRIRGTSPIVKLVKSRKASLQKTLASRRKSGTEKQHVDRIKMPRFVRLNHIKTTSNEVHAHFESSLNLKFMEKPESSTATLLSGVPKGKYTVDPLLPDIFILPSGTNLHTDSLVNSGAIVLQDRSSCLTALALNPPSNAICVDTCASPGNKTLHMASLMRRDKSGKGGGGRITAFERDPTRLGTLQRRIGEQGAETFVKARGADFMHADVSENGEFKDVTHVLIDPSCSGSGLAADSATGSALTSEYDQPSDSSSKLAVVGGGASDSQKVKNLARVQVEILLHAMKLPNLQVVAYSTCSVYREENEDVVLEVLQKQNKFRCARAIPTWPHRGLENVPEFAKISPLVCRATYEKDGTNGFFVARFERISEDEKGAEKKKKKKKKRKEEGVEDESCTASVSVKKARVTTTKVKVALPPKPPCVTFSKRGNCKFGKRCRFSHETQNSPHHKINVDKSLMEEMDILNEF
ncbi:hypothetical protein TrLO_g7829 [Triparma laevis f. longispina]|uniref:C3H1-type domain-containing protein n=1 Tax=Triparma laevis f. longispina TaxID=1714387 RepID=A0A9W6ZMB9_9STRA|nr:hypothetical protein TrLO_g7829 [Triparma laevis f. longispina]